MVFSTNLPRYVKLRSLDDVRLQYRIGQFYLAVVLLLSSVGLFAADLEHQGKSIALNRIGSAPTIDGMFAPGEWEGATMISDFHQIAPVQYGPPSEPSEVFVTFDQNFLYIGAKLYDSEPEEIIARQLVQGLQFWADDRFTLILDPLNSRRSGYEFEVNPNGVRADATFESADSTNNDWDGIWAAKSSVDANGWQTEMAIPFKTLNFDPNNSVWGISFAREIARKRERLAWSSFDRRVNLRSTGVANGITGISQGVGLDILPSVTMTQSKDFNSAGLKQSDLEPSLDIFYKLTPSLTGIMTINTDFSAVDVDDRRINLTRFSLFFPEKREFFLQDSEVFRFADLDENGTPFFSRRIGLSDEGDPVDLIVGLKIAGKIRDWNIGLLAVTQDGYDDIEQQQLIVGRASYNVLEESSIGMIFTAGDPTSNLDNSVIGFDFNFRDSQALLGRTVESSIWYQQSHTENLSGEDSAYGFNLSLPNSEGLFGWFGHKTLESNFNPALGFVNRGGIREYNFGTGYSIWPQSSLIRSARISLDAEQTNDIGGALETRRLRVSPIDISAESGDHLRMSIANNTEVLSEGFDILPGVIIPAGRYDFTRYQVRLRGAEQRKFVPSLGFSSGGFFTGTRSDVEFGLGIRPSKHLLVDLDYEQSVIDLPEGAFTTRLYRARINVAFNVRWSWVNSLQFDNISNNLSINSRLKWIREAGKELTLVVDHGFVRDFDNRFQSTDRLLVLKIAYLFRF